MPQFCCCCCCFVFDVIFTETWPRLVIHPFKHLLDTICSYTLLTRIEYLFILVCLLQIHRSQIQSSMTSCFLVSLLLLSYYGIASYGLVKMLLNWLNWIGIVLHVGYPTVCFVCLPLIELNHHLIQRLYPSVCFFVCHWLNRTISNT